MASRYQFNEPGFDSAPVEFEESIQVAVVVGVQGESTIVTASPFLKQPVFFTSTEWRSLNVGSYFDRGGPMPSAKAIGKALPLRNSTFTTVLSAAAVSATTAESKANRRQLAREMRQMKWSPAGGVARDMAVNQRVLLSPARSDIPRILKTLGRVSAAVVSDSVMLSAPSSSLASTSSSSSSSPPSPSSSVALRGGAVAATAALAAALGVAGFSKHSTTESFGRCGSGGGAYLLEQISPLHDLAVTDELGLFESDSDTDAADGGDSTVGASAGAGATENNGEGAAGDAIEEEEEDDASDVRPRGEIFFVSSAAPVPKRRGGAAQQEGAAVAAAAAAAEAEAAVSKALRSLQDSLGLPLHSASSSNPPAAGVVGSGGGGGDGSSGGGASGVAALVRDLQARGHVVLFVDGGEGGGGGGEEGRERGWGADVTAVLQLPGTPPAVEDAADVLVLVEPNKSVTMDVCNGDGKGGGNGNGDSDDDEGGCAFSGGAGRGDGGGAKEEDREKEEGNGALSRLASAISLARTVACDYEAFQAEVSCQMCTLA